MVPPLDAADLPQTRADEIAAGLAELIEQHTEEISDVELHVATAREQVQEAASDLLAARNEGKVDDWLFYIIGFWLLSKAIPQCHVHIHWHVGRTIAGVKAVAAGTTSAGLAAAVSTGAAGTGATAT